MNEEHRSGSVQFAYFFFPLPEPLGIPAGWNTRFVGFPDLRKERAEVLFKDEGGMDRAFRCSIAIRQVPQSVPMAGFLAAWSAAVSALPMADPVDLSGAPDIDTVVTVAEVGVVIDPNAEDPLTDACDTAIDAVQHLQQAFYVLTQEPTSLLELDLLPPMIPTAIRTIHLDEESPDWPDSLEPFMVNVGRNAMPSPPEQVAPQLLDHLDEAASFVGGGPLAGFTNLRREALLAYRSGNRVVTATLLGAASEALLKDLMQMLMWERGVEPAQVAELLPIDAGIVAVVKSRFAPMLGGVWQVDSAGPVKSWFDDVVVLRNRVMHGSHLPTRDEMHGCMEAFRELETYVVARLGQRVTRFPLVSHLYMGSANLDRRGLRSRWEDSIAITSIPTDVVGTISRFMSEVRRHQRGGPFVGDTAGAMACLVIYANDRTKWWLHDQAAGLACPGTLTNPDEVNDFVAPIVESVLTHSRRDAVSIGVAGARLDPGHAPCWSPEGDALPLLGYRRFASSLFYPEKEAG